MRTPFVLLLLAATACARGGPPRHPVALSGTPAAGPREVVVLLVVDQFAGWIAEERVPLLPHDGGFARLARESGGLSLLELAHGVTDTAPGHSALFTGRTPRESGIGANEVVSADGSNVSILRDESTHLVGSTGASSRAGSSLAVLRVDTLADRLRARAPGAHIVSLSLKDRGALFGGGRHPDAVLYFDPTSNEFVTSSAFVAAMPAWATGLASHERTVARQAEPWTMLDAAFVREHVRVVDAAPGEGDLYAFGTSFPHDFFASSRPGYAFRASPRSDAALVDLAIAALDAYAADDEPLLLVVSLSATDYVGHIFGPSSFEAWDTFRRLDGELGRLFASLDGHFGAGGWSALLSADHGGLALPEEDIPHEPWCGRPDPFERPCARVVRIDVDAIPRLAEAAIERELGPGPFLLGFADPYLRLGPNAARLSSDDRATLEAVVERTVRGLPGIADVITLRTSARCASPTAGRDPICASIVPELGEFYVVAAADAFFDSSYVPGYGGGHGAPTVYNRRVPFFFRPAAHHAAERRASSTDPLPFSRYFETADRLLGGDGTP